MFRGLGRYPGVLFHHWRAVLIAWAGSAGLLAGFSLRDAIHWPISRWVLVFGIGLLVAQFLAWREENTKRETAEKQYDELVDQASERSISLERFTLNVIPATGTVQIGVVLKNFGPRVIRYKMISMIITLSDVAADPFTFEIDAAMIVPGSENEFAYAAINGLDVSGDIRGEMELTLQYGHPDLPFAREFHAEHRLRLWGKPYVNFIKSSPRRVDSDERLPLPTGDVSQAGQQSLQGSTRDLQRRPPSRE